MEGDDGGSVAIVDSDGKKKTLASGFYTAQGLAWSPDGKEVWFTGSRVGANRALYAVTLRAAENRYRGARILRIGVNRFYRTRFDRCPRGFQLTPLSSDTHKFPSAEPA